MLLILIALPFVPALGSVYWQRVNFTEKSGVWGPSEYVLILRAFYEDFGSPQHTGSHRDITCRYC